MDSIACVKRSTVYLEEILLVFRMAHKTSFFKFKAAFTFKLYTFLWEAWHFYIDLKDKY